MTRLLIVAAIRLYREGLARVLEGRADLQVVGTARDAIEALELLQRVDADVVLLDLTPGDSADVARAFSRSAPHLKLVLLAFDDSQEEMVVECFQAGAAGYVPPGASLEDLTAQIHGVVHGELPCPPRVAAWLARHLGQGSAGTEARVLPLTPRERQVALLISRGLSNKEIAQTLHLSLATVKHHCHHLLEKLSVHRRAEVMARLRCPTVSALSALAGFSLTT